MTKEERKEYMKVWYQTNKQKIKIKEKQYRDDNKDKIKKRIKKYRQENSKIISERNKKYRETNKNIISQKRKLNKTKIKEYNKKYYQKNKEFLILKSSNYAKNHRKNINKRLSIYNKNKIKTDDLYKIKKNIRSLVSNSISGFGKKKNTKTAEILGCSFEEFKTYLESKFESWMSWDNYGKYNGQLNFGWDLDHIIPISSAKTEEAVISLNHYTNFQPLCSYINRVLKKMCFNFL